MTPTLSAELRKLAWQMLLLWPAVLTGVMLALGRPLGESLVYAWTVPATIGALYATFYTLGAALFPEIAGRLRRTLSFHVPFAVVGGVLGLKAAGAVAGAGEPSRESLGLGALITCAFVFFFGYRRVSREYRAAQLRALKAQMQPHFLFNSLNSLSELIYEDAPQAAAMTQRLADLYRQILASSKEKTSPVASELAIVRDYLELERLRHGDRLVFTIRPGSDTDAHLPSLLLQTLVENAVKHGIAKAAAGGRVDVEIVRLPDGLHEARVTNTGAPLTHDGTTGGTGLANTKERLSLLYGDSHGFSLRRLDDGATRASFRFSGRRHD